MVIMLVERDLSLSLYVLFHPGHKLQPDIVKWYGLIHKLLDFTTPCLREKSPLLSTNHISSNNF